MPADGDRRVVADHLRRAPCSTTSLITGLTLPGMIELPGCVAGIADLADARARAAEPSQRMSLAIFDEADGDRLQLPATPRRRRPCARLRLEVVLGLDERHARVARRSRRSPASANSGCELMPVPTAVPPSGSSRSASQRSHAHARSPVRRPARRSRRTPARAGSASRPAGACGRSSRRRRTPRPSLRASSRSCSQRRDQLFLDRDRGRDVHRRRDHVVGALLHVDVVVGVDRLCRRARGRGSRWRGWRSPRWRSCWSRCRCRSGRCRRRTGRRACPR